MTTPHERTDGASCNSPDQCLSASVGTAEHCLCGLVGLLCTGVVLALYYPMLVTVTQPLYVLSSTALIAIITTLWLLTWLGAECVWEWRTARALTEP